MSDPALSTMAPCSRPSTPRSAPPAAVALRPALTDAARGAFPSLGRGGETPLSLTKKRSAVRCGATGEGFDGFRAG
jgi:hypothetical protein